MYLNVYCNWLFNMRLSGSVFLCLLVLVVFSLGRIVMASDDHESHSSHSSSHSSGHSDALMVLLQHKIALQKLQGSQLQEQPANSASLAQQAKHLQQVMPVLQGYMNTPKSYYLTTEMYHDSLENRAAMLADFSKILVRYQKQLVSPP